MSQPTKIRPKFTYRNVNYTYQTEDGVIGVRWIFNLGDILGPKVQTLVHGTALTLPEMHEAVRRRIDSTITAYNAENATHVDQFERDNDSA